MYKAKSCEHFCKRCPRPLQELLLADVRMKTGKGKDRFTTRELFPDGCADGQSPATTGVCRRISVPAEEEGQSQSSEIAIDGG